MTAPKKQKKHVRTAVESERKKAGEDVVRGIRQGIAAGLARELLDLVLGVLHIRP